MTAALEVGGSGQQHAPAALYPRERPSTHFTGGWVGPRPVWTVEKFHPHRDSITDRPARSQSLYRLSYRAHKSYGRMNKFNKNVENKVTMLQWSPAIGILV